MNKVFLLGNLTRDPETRMLDNESVVVNFGIAVNERWTDRDGNAQERVDFIDVTAWNRQGELVAEYFRKGSPILFEGKLRYESWEDAESGQKRNRLTVTLQRFQFLPKNPPEGTAPAETADGSDPHGDGVPF